ncbi:MAG: hypothetical protein KGJ13_07690 [Patescibacteria group bacterium]|nr:hypothetical protein [Patescibacteria group bacterium]
MSKRVRRKTQHDIFVSNVKKLQRAGLIGKVDLRKKASPAIIRKIEKYRPLLRGKATVVVAPDTRTAARLRKTLGLKGSGKTIVIPKEKGERYRYQKTTGEIVSTRKGYAKGETIKKTLSKGFPAPPEKGSGKRLYYTIPERTRGAGRLKRKTFGSFDEMLYYLSKYEVDFEDIEDRVEVEEVTKGSRKDKVRQKKIHDDSARAYRRYKRKRRASLKNKPRAGSGR